jgi:hypothetical protein
MHQLANTLTSRGLPSASWLLFSPSTPAVAGGRSNSGIGLLIHCDWISVSAGTVRR